MSKTTKVTTDSKAIAEFVAKKVKDQNTEQYTSFDETVFKNIVLSTILFLNLNNNSLDICNKSILKTFSKNNSLYDYIKHHERRPTSALSFYESILVSILQDLKVGCGFNDDKEISKIKIGDLENDLWLKVGFEDKQNIISFVNDVIEKFNSDPDILKYEKSAFTKVVKTRFPGFQKDIDVTFTYLHNAIPEIKVEQEIENFLKQTDFKINTATELDNYKKLLRRSIEYLSTFITKFNDKYKLKPTNTYFAINVQLTDLINKYNQYIINKQQEILESISRVFDSVKLTDFSGLTRITDKNFKDYWLEISKDNRDKNKIMNLFKSEYIDFKTYVLKKFYGIDDISKQNHLNNTFTSFVFLCHMLEFMHANPQESGKRKYIDIYKELKIFDTDGKINDTETDMDTVKSVFFRYLQMSLIGRLEQQEKDLINSV